MEVDEKGLRYASLEEIFTKEQAKELKKILKEAKEKKRDPLELVDVFKQLFSKWEQDLMAKEIYPDYLAYAFSFVLSKVGYDRALFELDKIIHAKEKK